jgi:RNA polymerase sigma factor (sigma-70 family)
VDWFIPFRAFLAACFRRWGAAEVAIDELIHDVFLLACAAAVNPENMTNSQLRTWLATVAYNHYLNTARRTAHRLIVERRYAENKIRQTVGVADSVVEIVEWKERITLVKAAINRLARHERLVIRRRMDGWSYSRIARKLDRPVSRIRTIEELALKQLRRDLEAYWDLNHMP